MYWNIARDNAIQRVRPHFNSFELFLGPVISTFPQTTVSWICNHKTKTTFSGSIAQSQFVKVYVGILMELYQKILIKFRDRFEGKVLSRGSNAKHFRENTPNTTTNIHAV